MVHQWVEVLHTVRGLQLAMSRLCGVEAEVVLDRAAAQRTYQEFRDSPSSSASRNRQMRAWQPSMAAWR
jgi:hypothetical protein